MLRVRDMLRALVIALPLLATSLPGAEAASPAPSVAAAAKSPVLRPKLVMTPIPKTPTGTIATGAMHVAEPDDIPAIFMNTSAGYSFASGQWITADLSGSVPSGTTAVYLQGILIITHGTSTETCDLSVGFRGDSVDRTYTTQTIEAVTNGGQRSTASLWVPLRSDRTFDWFWKTPDSGVGTYPDHCAYGFNFHVNAWLS